MVKTIVEQAPFEQCKTNLEKGDFFSIFEILDYPKLTNVSDPETGETLLIWAVKNKNIPVIKFLIYSGANPYFMDKKKKNAFDYATEEIKTLIDGKDLFSAILVQDEKKIKKILDKNPHLINVYNQDNVTPIFFALLNKTSPKIINLLLQYSPDIYLPLYAGKSLIDMLLNNEITLNPEVKDLMMNYTRVTNMV